MIGRSAGRSDDTRQIGTSGKAGNFCLESLSVAWFAQNHRVVIRFGCAESAGYAGSEGEPKPSAKARDYACTTSVGFTPVCLSVAGLKTQLLPKLVLSVSTRASSITVPGDVSTVAPLAPPLLGVVR